MLSPAMELRFWRTKKQEEVDFVLIKDRRPYPIEIKSQWSDSKPPPGLKAFCKRYPDTPVTFTVSGARCAPVEDGERTHHFLAFEELPSNFELIRSNGDGSERSR